ncbi:MAG: hypothetical protein WBD31_22670 [Rubripirellula sp.]
MSITKSLHSYCGIGMKQEWAEVFQMSDKELIERLRKECQTMRSRVEAILNCEQAIEELMMPEVFGAQYRSLLNADCSDLSKSIELCDTALGASEA